MLPTSTDVSIDVKTKVRDDADAVVIFASESKRAPAIMALSNQQRAAVDRLFAGGVVHGRAKEIAFDLVDDGRAKASRVFVVGLGRAEKVTAETLRQAAGQATKALRKHRMKRVAIVAPALERVDSNVAADAVTTGLLLAAFQYAEYKGKSRAKDDEAGANRLSVTIVPERDERAVREVVDRARIIAEAQNFARTIACRPGNDINPPKLAQVAQQLAREVGLRVRVLDEKQMARLGMGGILGVGSGSATPPRMIVLEWKGSGFGVQGSGKKRGRRSESSPNPEPRTLNPLLVVGKAITFDTGGISIKPAANMGRMIFDKSGGMAVLGLMAAVARLKLPVHVVGILASAENHVSATAYRPGDILRMYNGVTVEVTNTDAEGRLVLGDALAWGIETYKPSAVLDLATLTGGCVVALGFSIAGLMCNDDALYRELQTSADATGEKVWRLPLPDEVRDMIKSVPADIVNSAGKYASPLQGGVFLSHFVPDGMPWAHLDIAGPAETEKELPYYGKGATGWGVRTLVDWVERRAAK
jgi:leucyl aminopeptidase